MNNVLDKITYGHFIATALKPGEEMKSQRHDYIAAGTMNWVSQVAFKPATMMIAVGKSTDLNETIEYSGHFSLHLLGEMQSELIEPFAHKSEITAETINGIPYQIADNELIIKDAVGVVVCKVLQSVDAGDHVVYFGSVVYEKELLPGSMITTQSTGIRYTQDKASN
jgi:hypothetical protein